MTLLTRSAVPFVLALSASLAPCGSDPKEQTPEVQGPPAALPKPAAPKTPPARVYFVGHSLLSDVPDLVRAFSTASPGRTLEFKEQSIPGAPLRWHWGEAERAKAENYNAYFEPTYQGRYDLELAKSGWDALVLVDSVPRGGGDSEQETAQHLVLFTEFARRANPALRVLLYEPWHCIQSGTEAGCDHDRQSPTRKLPWRQRLEADGPMWERIVAAANAQLPEGATPIELIPAGRFLGRLVDAAARGELPGFQSERDLFEDTIHLNHYGKYFVSLVTWSTLYGRPPKALPLEVKNRWGVPYWNHANWQGKQYPAPSPEAIRRMQEIAAEPWAQDASDS